MNVRQLIAKLYDCGFSGDAEVIVQGFEDYVVEYCGNKVTIKEKPSVPVEVINAIYNKPVEIVK